VTTQSSDGVGARRSKSRIVSFRVDENDWRRAKGPPFYSNQLLITRTKNLIVDALSKSMKNAPTSGTTR